MNSKIPILIFTAVSALCVRAQEAAPNPSPEILAMVDDVLKPFWRETQMNGETLFFGERKEGEAPTATLFFPPEKILSVRSATHETTYEEGKDYSIDMATGTFRRLPNSRIPFKTMKEMYPPEDSPLPKYKHKRGDPKTCLIFGEGAFFHQLQVEVTYTHKAGLWTGYVPKFSGDSLPKTMAKLRAKEPLKLCMTGDSISYGCNASALSKVAPAMPAYGELVSMGLEKSWGSKVTFRNFSVGGWTSKNGVDDVAKVMAEKPDLVIIAYGMNDSGGASPEVYSGHIQTIMTKVKEASPGAEFILVASMLPNAEWHYPTMENFPRYRDALTKLCGNGVALADMTSVWGEFLRRKKYHDITGNGLNHPNDFGHRLYAQVILGLLVAPKP
jgi:lysophospholipase L1-like esterase